MIDAKEAVRLATEKAVEMLGQTGSLEEIDREHYRGRDTWSITLGFVSQNVSPLVLNLSVDYKRFFLDAETGEFIAMKIRELASK